MVFSKLRGAVLNTLFQLGLGGPQLKNDSGKIDARDPADAAFVNVRAAAPLISDDLTTKLYVDGKSPLAAPLAVAAGATVASPARAPSYVYVIDGTGFTAATINSPTLPLDGDLLLCTVVGTPMTSPPLIVGTGVGVLVSDPNNPGGPALASVNTGAVQGPYIWQYQAATTTWQLLGGLVPVLVSTVFNTAGTFTFTAPFSGRYSIEACGTPGAGGSGPPGVVGLVQQNGGGGGGAPLPVGGTYFLGAGVSETITIPAAATGVAGAAGNNGADVTVGNILRAPGAAGGEYGGTPAAGTSAAGGCPQAARGVGRIPPNNPTWTEAGLGGWGGSSAGPPGQGGTQGRGEPGFGNILSNTNTLGVGGIGGVPGASNTNPGGCGGGGGAAAVGAPGVVTPHDGAAGRPGGAGSAAGTGGNGFNGLNASSNGGGGGGGGAGGNGLLGGGTGGTGGNSGVGWVVIRFTGFSGV